MKSKPYDMLYQIIVCLYILYAYMYDMCLYMFIRLLSRILLIITNHHYIYITIYQLPTFLLPLMLSHSHLPKHTLLHYNTHFLISYPFINYIFYISPVTYIQILHLGNFPCNVDKVAFSKLQCTKDKRFNFVRQDRASIGILPFRCSLSFKFKYNNE